MLLRPNIVTPAQLKRLIQHCLSLRELKSAITFLLNDPKMILLPVAQYSKESSVCSFSVQSCLKDNLITPELNVNLVILKRSGDSKAEIISSNSAYTNEDVHGF